MPPPILRLLSRPTLEKLLEARFECETLDYKLSVDLKSARGRQELTRDVLAMANTRGGFIIIGVVDKTFDVVGISDEQAEQFKDGKTVNDALEKSLRSQIIVHAVLHRINLPDGQTSVPIAMLFIPPSDELIPAPADGNCLTDDGKRTDCLFRHGDVLVRRADSTTLIRSPHDLRREPVDFMKHFDHLVSPTSEPLSDDQLFFNPYNIAVAAQNDMFKGREDDIRKMVSLIANGNHLTIYGLQRVGKTSFVQRALSETANEYPALHNTVLATVNLQELGSECVIQRDLIDMMVFSICQAIDEDTKEKPVRDAFDRYLNEAERRLGDKNALFRAFQYAVEQILERFPKRVILFLDEFSELCRAIEGNDLLSRKPSYRITHLPSDQMYVDIQFMKWCSNLMKSSKLHRKLTFVFAARPFVSQYDSERDMQVLKLTKSIWLYYLDEIAAKALIRDPIKTHLRIGEDCVDYLYRQTAGHPYLIQYIMQEVVDKVIDNGKSAIRLEDIKMMERDLIKQGAPYQALFNLLDSDYGFEEIKFPDAKDLGKGTLALISKMGTERPEGWVEERDIKKMLARYGIMERAASTILSKLKNAEIIKEMHVENLLFIRVAVPLLRKRYVEQNYYLQYFPQKPK